MNPHPHKATLGRAALRSSFIVIAVVVTLICIVPYVGVLAAAMSGSLDTLTHLAQTVLGRYTLTTIVLVALVMAAAQSSAPVRLGW